MVEILEGRVLSRYLLDRYSKKPNGWSFTLFPPAREDNGFFGAFVGGPDEVWQLKMDSVFKPNPLMLGARADADPARAASQGTIPYGYRRLDRNVTFELLKALARADGEEGESDGARIDRNLMDRILRPLAPVAPKPGENYAEGPFVLTDRGSLAITQDQKQLEDRLSGELRRLLRNKYSSYG